MSDRILYLDQDSSSSSESSFEVRTPSPQQHSGHVGGVGNTTPTPPPAPRRQPRNRAWSWTWNNPSMTGDELKAVLQQDPRIQYCVFQLEQGEHGTRHFQGYVFMKNAVTMQAIKRLIHNTVHLEPSRGDPDQNKAYCTKDDTRIAGPWEFGELPQKGRRKDLERLRDAVLRDGLTQQQIIDTDLCSTLLMYPKAYYTLQAIRAKKQPKTKPEIWLLYGATGTGKSRLAREIAPNAYEKPDGRWWDGYDGEQHVIWDDFDYQKYPIQELLKVTDRYGKKVEVKGSYVELTMTKLVFTSNTPPELWYQGETQEHRDALMRRIDHIIEFKADGTRVTHK